MHRETTIYDIAEALNLSAATVSRALKDHPAIHNNTKQLVKQKAEEMGYRLNSFASNLRRRRTNTLGVIVPRLNSNFMSSALAAMERVANEAGYNLLIAQSLESGEKEQTNVVTMFNSRVDGLLVSLAYDTHDYSHFDRFISRKIPVYFFDRVPDDTVPGGRVVIDNFRAGEEVTAHLIANGCRRIFHVTGDLKRNVYSERYEGYRSALKTHGLEFSDDMLIVKDLSEDSGRVAAREVHAREKKPDGVFISNDLCAVSFIKSIKELGYSVPGDVRVAGFNDDPVSQFIEPELTTVAYSGKQVGETAMKALLNILERKEDGNCRIVLPHAVIVRSSSTLTR